MYATWAGAATLGDSWAWTAEVHANEATISVRAGRTRGTERVGISRLKKVSGQDWLATGSIARLT